jgi:beta-lactam-binding protein with PASTA domain
MCIRDRRKLLDALRFGKSLDFPLEGTQAYAQGPRPAQTYKEKRAQRMGGAIHEKTFDRRAADAKGGQKTPKRIPLAAEAPPDDVPWWLRGLVWALSGMVALLAIWYVFFNLTQKKAIDAPNLIGKSMTEARQVANGLGLELVNAGEEYNERYPQPKTVFFMDPAPGTPIKEGATIQVKLSAGTRMVEVPDLRGLHLSEGRVRLDAASLQLDPTIRREAARGFEEGLIIKTDPGPWEKVERGSQITITVSSGSERPDRPNVPAAELTPNTWSLQFTVRSTNAVMVRVEMTDARGEPQIVYESEQSNGDVVDLPMVDGFGKTATFRVYYNNNLEMTYPNRKGSLD